MVLIDADHSYNIVQASLSTRLHVTRLCEQMQAWQGRGSRKQVDTGAAARSQGHADAAAVARPKRRSAAARLQPHSITACQCQRGSALAQPAWVPARRPTGHTQPAQTGSELRQERSQWKHCRVAQLQHACSYSEVSDKVAMNIAACVAMCNINCGLHSSLKFNTRHTQTHTHTQTCPVSPAVPCCPCAVTQAVASVTADSSGYRSGQCHVAAQLCDGPTGRGLRLHA